MKLLSITVPCYNSQDYMEHCVNTLLAGGEEVEIIIVDDGSKDRTAEIADAFAAKYPTIIKAVHQENGGHGQAVNTGLANATGVYFKVVDSDDWVDRVAYRKVLAVLRKTVEENIPLDMLISNYVNDKVGERHKHVMQYHGALPRGRFFTWDDVKNFRMGHYMLMHALIFRRQILLDCNLQLPQHTFYVDNLYVYCPMVHVKNMYYLDVNFYRYFIGRGDQSVNQTVMIKRLDQQIRVNKLMYDAMDLSKIENPRLREYQYAYLEVVTGVSCTLLLETGNDADIERRKELWKYVKDTRPEMYKHMTRHRLLSAVLNMNSKPMIAFQRFAYRVVLKVFGY